METIKIDPAVLDKTPKELVQLPDATYTLTKVEGKNLSSYVSVGDSVTGYLEIVNVAKLGLPGVRVSRAFRYIRTSPIVKLVDVSQKVIVFKTEGGLYSLEKHDEA